MLKFKYNISLEYYDELLLKQKGKCAICRTLAGDSFLVVDHDHKTKGVRGLLCAGCNLGLGHFRENKKILLAAIMYLNER